MTQGKLRKAVYIQSELFKRCMYTYLHNCLYCTAGRLEIFYSQFLGKKCDVICYLFLFVLLFLNVKADFGWLHCPHPKCA